jgi:lysozyme
MNWFCNLFKKNINTPIVKKEIVVKDTISTNKKFDFDKWDGKFADISHWEAHFDIDTYECPILLNKCSDGLKFVDKTHALRKRLCEEKGIVYSGYHFFECEMDAEKQATFYKISHGEFKYNPILDFETNGSQNEKDLKNHKEDCLVFLKCIEKLSGKKPIIYTGLSLAKFLNLDSRFAEYPLWIAAYRSKSNPPMAPMPWREYFAWQYSENDPIDGIGNCDANIYNKQMDLFNLGKKG